MREKPLQEVLILFFAGGHLQDHIDQLLLRVGELHTVEGQKYQHDMSAGPRVAIHKGVVLHQTIAQPSGFLLKRRIGAGVSETLEWCVERRLQKPFIPQAGTAPSLVYQLLVEQLTAKGVEFISQKEAIDTTTPTGKFMLTVFGAVAELEREYILQRQQEGIAIAKEQGKYTGRKPIGHPDFDAVVSRWRKGELTAVQAMKRLGMTSSTFYRHVRLASSGR